MLLSMGPQIVGQDLVTEQQPQSSLEEWGPLHLMENLRQKKKNKEF